MKNLEDVKKANLCLGCGLCTLNLSSNDVLKMHYSSVKGHSVPIFENTKSNNAIIGFDSCPGKGYQIETLAREYKLGNNFNSDLGLYDNIFSVTAESNKVLANASSSGIMTTILDYMIQSKIVDRAIVTKFKYTRNGPVAEPFTTNNIAELLIAQGSKYCPVDFSKVLDELKINAGICSYVFVGTPCQIASLRYIQNNVQDLGIKFFIGNFCGGFKSYNNLNRLISLNKIRPNSVNYFRFRGGGQPGSMKIQTDNNVVEVPYPEYVKMTGYSKLKRCHFCVDATAELADFSCGDAWLPEFLSTKIPTSIVITRTKAATEILDQMKNLKLISSGTLSASRTVSSQFANIETKKHRQRGRIILYKLLGAKLPQLEEGFSINGNYSLFLESRVFISHRLKFVFEKLGLFYYFYYKNNFLSKVFSKIFKDIYN